MDKQKDETGHRTPQPRKRSMSDFFSKRGLPEPGSRDEAVMMLEGAIIHADLQLEDAAAQTAVAVEENKYLREVAAAARSILTKLSPGRMPPNWQDRAALQHAIDRLDDHDRQTRKVSRTGQDGP